MAIDKITTAAITDGTITSSDLASGTVQNQSAFRNIIINGDMSIAQRGTSFTGLGNGDSAYTLDRFKWSEEGSMTNEWTVSQSTTVPSGQGFAKSLKVDCTTADTSIDSGNIQYVEQRVEGQNLQYLKYGTSSAESTTLSFWVRSNKTGTYTIALINNDGSERLSSQAYTISSADTWEKKTLTFTGDTSQAFDNDNASSLSIQFNLVAGTNKTSGSLQSWGSNTQANRAVGQVNLADSTSNEWYVTGVQLETGTSASDFEFLPYDVNSRRCYRYYYRINFGGGLKYVGYGQVDNDDANMPAICNVFPEQMRTAPTALEQSGTAGNYKVREAGTYSCTSVPTFNNASTWNATVTFIRSGITSSNGFAQGELLKCGGDGGYLGWSAEL